LRIVHYAFGGSMEDLIERLQEAEEEIRALMVRL